MFNRCCCQAPTCTIISPGTTMTSATWTQVSGSWSFASSPDQRWSTTSTDGIIIHNTAHPQGLSTGAFHIPYIELPGTGLTARLLLSYLDPDNHLFIDYRVLQPDPTPGTNVLARLGYRQGGSDTFLDNMHPYNLWTNNQAAYGLRNHRLCFNGSRLSCGSTSMTPGPYYADCPLDISGLTLGTQVGFQVIGNTGTVQFGSLFSSGIGFYGDNTAVGGTCNSCVGAAGGDGSGGYCDPVLSGTPKEYSVYVTGIANNVCGSCTSLNGSTFVIDEPYITNGVRGDVTYKNFPALPAACTGMGQAIYLHLGTDLGNNPDTNMTVWFGGNLTGSNQPDGYFTLAKTSRLCNEVLTKVGGVNYQASIFGTQRCNWTGATAQITPNVN